MKLVLGPIPDDFNPTEHIPMGLYCFAGRETICPDLTNANFLKLSLDNKQLHEIDGLTAKESLRLVKILAHKHHGENYFEHSFRFWKTIYYPLIAIVVQSIYARQLVVEKYIEQYKDEGIEIDLEPDDFSFYCDNDDAVVNAICSIQFSAWVFSRMIEYRSPGSPWILNKADGNLKEVRYKFKAPLRKEWRHTLINKLRIKYIYGFSAFDLLFFNLLTFRKVHTTVTQSENYSEISSTPNVKWHIDIEKILDSIIPNHYKQTLSHGFRTSQRLFDFSNNLHFDFDSKLQAAHAIENKNLILSNQHGGHNYGSAATFESNRYIEYDCDFHITWGPIGYINSANAKFIPLPSPLLSKVLNKHSGESNKIIWVGTAMQIAPFRMESLFWNYAHEYRGVKKNVFSEISQSILWDNFFYRPYPANDERYLSDEEFYKGAIPALKILPGNLHTEVMRCNLLILDHPGTTWNIAMAMNTPLLLFWDKTWFPLNDEADSYLERFRELGIFFDDPYKMQHQMISLYEKFDNFSQWWSNPEIQSLRSEWMSKYALAEKKWRNKWVETYLRF